MSSYTSAERYLGALARRSALPEGFCAAASSLTFTPKERPKPLPMNLALILLDQPTASFAARYTSNRLAGAPVLIGRERLEESRVRGVLVNNKIANVGAPNGVAEARAILQALGELLGTPERQLLPASTGIIGWALPVAEILSTLPVLAAGLQRRSLLPVARAIMTTDAYPKLRRARVGTGSIVGVAKGAGMIEPALATMLVFLLTDLEIGRSVLREELARCAEESFNRISVDGDQSTSDMVVALSSRRKPAVPRRAFREGLAAVCRALAQDIVRNGEGVGHVIRVRLRGLPERLALGLGKAVVNSPLVKTAVFGNDPNVGRILSALGDHLSAAPDGASFELGELSVRLGGITLYEGGAFRLDPGKERALSGYLRRCAMEPGRKGYPQHERCVEIEIERRGRKGGATLEVCGADLSYEYVRENADYRS
jgi:glutamate N-acetyltransferase/amino-acid N-acetyltransferase